MEFVEKMKAWAKSLRGESGSALTAEEKAAADKKRLEDVAGELPGTVMPHKALSRQKQKMAELDAINDR